MADFRRLRNVKLGTHGFCVTEKIPVDIDRSVAGAPWRCDRARVLGHRVAAATAARGAQEPTPLPVVPSLLLLDYLPSLRDMDRHVEAFLTAADTRTTNRRGLSRIAADRDADVTIGRAYSL
jgi:hypothetical protein